MKVKTLLAICLLLAGTKAMAQPDFTAEVLKEGLFIPWEITYGPDDRLWFTQKNGYICALDHQTGKLDTLYHETNTRIRGEGGMLGMAIHPDFVNNPHVFVAYEYETGNNYRERVVRYTYDGAELGSPQILLDNIPGANIHNGCRLLIAEGKLFITTGDAANSGTAQNLSSLNGKTLRINLDGSIPSDNTIPGSPVWNWGQRNVQGLAYANGHLYSSMHGAVADDEINILVGGRNYGWPNVEGFCEGDPELDFCSDSNVVEPIYVWTPTIATGGIDYYSQGMFPSLQNSILMVTLKDESLYQLKLTDTHDEIETTVRMELDYGRLRDIAIAPDGRLFISTSNSNASGTGSHIDKIIMLYDPLSANKEQGQGDAIYLYPNPVQQDLYVDWQCRRGEPGHFTLYNLQGAKMQEQILQIPARLDMREYQPGIYLLQCESKDGEVLTRKVVRK